MKRIGSAGGGKTRTSWDLAVTVAIPFSRWGAEPFVSVPVPFPEDVVTRYAAEPVTEPGAAAAKQNALGLARAWSSELAQNANLTKAKIARREGLTRARVTQIMGLLELDPDIQDALLRMQNFPERKLRPLLRCSNHVSQMRLWQELQLSADW